MIEEMSTEITTCSCCKNDHLRQTYKINKDFLCIECAARKAFNKATKITTKLVSEFRNNVDYLNYLNVAREILTLSPGPRRLRAWRARMACPPEFIFRKITLDKYVVLCPAGKIYVEATNPNVPKKPLPKVDPDSPFESICEHVQDQLNKGLPLKDVAEFIWSIRGKHDNITAMMYNKYVIVTWPEEQRMLFPKC